LHALDAKEKSYFMNKHNHHNPHRHWHYVYKKRRNRVLGISSRRIALGQMVSLIGAVLAGFHLNNNKASLALIVGTFVVLPGILDLNGSLGGALSAKINHRLEDPRSKVWHVFVRSLGFAFLIALLAGMVVGAAGGIISTTFFDADFVTIFKLSIGAILLSALIGFPLIAILTLVLRKFGVNPDDVMGPVETSFFDFLAVFTLVLVAGWLL